MNDLEKLIAVIQETRKYLARQGNDYSWSSWIDQNHALAEIHAFLAQLENGSIPDMEVLFAPTGPSRKSV